MAIVYIGRPRVRTDPGIFRQGGGGGPGQSDKKKLTVFFVLFLSSVILQKSNGHFKEIFHFSSFQRGSNIFQGGPNAYSLLETNITCNFPGESPRPDPSESALGAVFYASPNVSLVSKLAQ